MFVFIALFLFFTVSVEASPTRVLPKKNTIAVLLDVYTHSFGKIHLVRKQGEQDIYLVLKNGNICQLEWVEGEDTCVQFSFLKEVLQHKDCLLSFIGELPFCKKKINSNHIKKDTTFQQALLHWKDHEWGLHVI